MALGQYIAGMGFSNVGLGIAHSMAHTLGAVYDTPHGVACAMMLPRFYSNPRSLKTSLSSGHGLERNLATVM